MSISRVKFTPITLVLGALLLLTPSVYAEEPSLLPVSDLPQVTAPTYPSESIDSNPYVSKRLIIKTSAYNDLPHLNNISNIETITNNIHIIEFKTEESTAEAYLSLSSSPSIDAVAIDRNLYIQDESSEPISSPEHAISILEAREGYEAWGVSATGLDKYRYYLNQNPPSNTIRVAIVDTGINSAHEVFLNTKNESSIDYEGAYHYVNNSTDVEDDNGHGTMTAGTVIESSSDNVKVVPLKVMDSYGRGSLSNTMRAIRDIYPSVDIINLSLGLPDVDPSNNNAITPSEREVFESLLSEVAASGTIVVAAAGNEKSSVSYPASSSYTLAASSVNRQKEFSTKFSNYGPEVDFATPGQEVIVPCAHPSLDPITAYCVSNGTSISSPFLAAAVALSKSEFPSYTKSEIVDYLKQNAEDLGDPGKDDYFGNGRLDFNINRFYAPTVTVSDRTYSSTTSNGVNVSQNTVTNTLTITSEKSCVVLAVKDGTYASLTPNSTSSENVYTFKYDPYTASSLIVAIKGDINLDARVNLSDSNLIIRSQLSNSHFAHRNLSTLESALSDLNHDSRINLSDSNIIIRSQLSTSHFAYRKISW